MGQCSWGRQGQFSSGQLFRQQIIRKTIFVGGNFQGGGYCQGAIIFGAIVREQSSKRRLPGGQFSGHLFASMFIWSYIQPMVKQSEYPKTRSSRPDVFCKKGFLRNFAKFIGKHLCRPGTLFKKRLTRVFSCEFCEISKNTFFTEHLRWLLL